MNIFSYAFSVKRDVGEKTEELDMNQPHQPAVATAIASEKL